MIASIGTVGALTVALIQIRTERQYRLKAAAEGTRERHEEQARLISAFVGAVEFADYGPDNEHTWVNLVNGSDEPVYRLVVAIVFIQGTAPDTTERWLDEWVKDHPERARPLTTLGILPPGRSRVSIQGRWTGGLGGRSGAEIAFTDRAGSHWIRRATGKLEELPLEPLEYFKHWGLFGPHDLQTPDPMP